MRGPGTSPQNPLSGINHMNELDNDGAIPVSLVSEL